MKDHEIHEVCGYETARCACPRSKNPVLDPEVVARLAQQVKAAVERRAK